MPRPFFGPTRKESKELLFGLIGYKPAPDPRAAIVHEFHLDESKYQFISAPARTSKSYASSPEAVHDFFPDLEVDEDGRIYAATEENRVWLVGVDYSTIREWEYCWDYLILGKILDPFLAMGAKFTRRYNTPNQGNMVIEVVWPESLATREGKRPVSILEAKSASNEKSLQGVEVKTCIVSEAAEHDQRIVDRFLEPRSSRIIFPTTPHRKAIWLYEWMQRALESDRYRARHFQFNRWCNPRYDHERYEVRKLKSEATYGSVENDPTFLEMFEGQWTFEGGKVIPFQWLDRPDGMPNNICHLGQEPEWLDRFATYFVSMDYGYRDACVALLWGVGPEAQLLIVDEVYENHLEPREFLGKIRAMEARHGVHPRYYAPDPKQPLMTDIMRKEHGFPLFDRYKPEHVRNRAPGFALLRDALSIDPAVGEPRMRVHERCERTIEEWKQIRFKEGVRDEFGAGCIVGADHACDAARYGLMSRPQAQGRQEDWTRAYTDRARVRERARRRAMDRGTRLPGHRVVYA